MLLAVKSLSVSANLHTSPTRKVPRPSSETCCDPRQTGTLQSKQASTSPTQSPTHANHTKQASFRQQAHPSATGAPVGNKQPLGHAMAQQHAMAQTEKNEDEKTARKFFAFRTANIFAYPTKKGIPPKNVIPKSKANGQRGSAPPKQKGTKKGSIFNRYRLPYFESF